MRALTPEGLEPLLAEEILSLGGRNIVAFKRGISFVGDRGFLYKAHLLSSLSLKILIPLMEFHCHSAGKFYETLLEWNWENWIHEKETFLFECTGKAIWLKNSMYGSMLAKDALCDRMRKIKGQRPSVDKVCPDRWFYLHVTDEKVTLCLNATGEVMSKRGYRKQQGSAPLSEILASALVRSAKIPYGFAVVDGMCGSATLAIEATLYVLGIPVGVFREKYSFMDWPDFDETLWEKIYEHKISKIKSPQSKILALDEQEDLLNKARGNIRAARLEDVIILQQKNFFEYTPEEKKGYLLLNPPYGQRLQREKNFYRNLGSRLKHFWKGWEAWMIIPEEAYAEIGLKHKKRIRVKNGSIPCFLCGYELY